MPGWLKWNRNSVRQKQAVILNAPRHQKLKEMSEGIVSMFQDPDFGWSTGMAMVTTMRGGDRFGMAKAGLREQNRFFRCKIVTHHCGGIMANTAEIFNFPVPDGKKEPRVADPMMVIRALQMSC